MASKVGEVENHHQGVEELISSLPRDDHWLPCRLYGGFWLFEDWLPGTLAAQQHMVARDDDILVTACPKSGTTWLKSLVFAVVRRGTHPLADPLHPLRRTNPHDCVEFLEDIYAQNREADLDVINDREIGSSKGFGFVTFSSEQSMRDAIEGMNGQHHGQLGPVPGHIWPSPLPYPFCGASGMWSRYLIGLQRRANAAYLASKGLDIISAVATALKNSSFAKQATEKVFIQSDDSAVLSRFKEDSPYRRILLIKEIISDTPQSTIDEIKQIADAVNLPRSSIFPNSGGFLVTITDVVDKLQTANISVYVSTLRNEFMALTFDFFADPMLEVANYVSQVGVDGVVT
ncbi:hypothetical protein Taro_029598 [Colocasia esculenta]|uniref:Sulfotransferase n=1 Tax=Colocasia esculenta TaxID=4460 RepID=A0A843VJC0_COLES|nr:hypothetical protein [Colocasia esculenta]